MATSKRSIEVDFFRGLALVVIMLDHIPGSLLSHITLHNYAFCDAAEAFVFVGGYSTAAAYMAIDARNGSAAAGKRFLRRGLEIYRAFLVTAALMLIIGVTLHSIRLDTVSVRTTEYASMLHRPFGMWIDVVSLRRQPFLSSVLPMYAAFALLAPLMLESARRVPWVTVGISAVIWYFAPVLARGLPSAYPEGWAFNPFAWQFIFVLGAMTRLRPVSVEFMRSRAGQMWTRVAFAAAFGFAFWQLFLTLGPSPGFEKQNLALIRLLNFGALAWLAAWAGSHGWVDKVAAHMPRVVRAGQQSLVCFVSGACISVVVDALSRPFHSLAPAWVIGGVTDACAIVLLLSIATIAAHLKSRRGAARPKQPTAGRPVLMAQTASTAPLPADVKRGG